MGTRPNIKSTADTFRFLIEQLPKEDRLVFDECTNGPQVLIGIQKLRFIENHDNGHAKGISRFIEAVQPLCSALDVLCQVDPIHFATVWGGLRVLIQLASNYEYFLEKLVESLKELAKEISFFKDVKDKCPADGSERLQEILEDVFQDLLEYLTGVTKIFFRSNGLSKSKIRVLAKAVWKPFRFDMTVAQMRLHRQRAADELLLLQFQKLGHGHPTEQQKNAHQPERTYSRPDDDYYLFHRIRDWLAPSSFRVRYDAARQARVAGTSTWIFEEPTFETWIQGVTGEGPCHLWVHGKPGSGKTVLASALLDWLKAEHSDVPTFYFFFDSVQSQSSTCTDAYRAILSQMLQRYSKDQKLLDTFSFAMYFGSDGQLTASPAELNELFDLCCNLPFLEDIFIILDGVDECAEMDMELAPKLHHLANLTHVSMALFSRPTVGPLIKKLAGLMPLTVSNSNANDIQKYVRLELEKIQKSRLLPRGLDLQIISQKLTRRADGMFLWARLMMSYLRCRALTPTQRRNAISELDVPEGLEDMYERIITQIAEAGKPSLKLASNIFMWLLHIRRDIGPAELDDAILAIDTEDIDEDAQDMNDFVDTVITTCGGLVEQEIAGMGEGGLAYLPFRFIHASVKEYLSEAETRERDRGPRFNGVGFLPPPSVANALLTTTLVGYLTERLPQQQVSDQQDFHTVGRELLSKYPLVSYAASFWTIHLEQTLSDTNNPWTAKEYTSLISGLNQLIAAPKAIMTWIEVCYILEDELQYQPLLNWSTELANSESPLPSITPMASDTEELGNCLLKIVHEWDEHLRTTPSCVWEEIGAYFPSKFLLRNPAVEVKPLVTAVSSNLDLSKGPINRISRLTSDGKHDVVLSVYPTKVFLDCYNDNQRREDIFRDGSFTQGWVARIEAFDVAKQTRLGALEIPLSPPEVLLQVYQTLSLGAIQFPLAINPTGRNFIILRTLYTTFDDSSTWGYTSEVLPLDECRFNRDFWLLPQKDATGGYSLDQYHRLNKQKKFERVCLYWLYFNDAGDHVCLAEQVRSSPVCVSVFNVVQNATRPLLVAQRAKWLRRFEEPYQARDRKEFELAFHPSLPVIALAGYTGIYLWDYTAASDDGFIKINAGAEDISYLSFTKDGKSCVVNMGLRGETRPEVFGVPDAFLVEEDQGTDAGGTLATPTGNNSQTLTLPNVGIIGALTPHLPTVLSGSQQVVVRGEKVADVTVANTNNTATLSIKAVDSSSGETVTLTRIPNWLGSSHVQPGVVLPDTPGAPVRVVLDKGIETWNRLAQASSEADSSGSQFPLVLERDARSFGKRRDESGPSTRMVEAGNKQKQIEDSIAFSNQPRRPSEQSDAFLPRSDSLQEEDLDDAEPLWPTIVEPEDTHNVRPAIVSADQDSTSTLDHDSLILSMNRSAGGSSMGPSQSSALTPQIESGNSVSSDGQSEGKKSWRERKKEVIRRAKSISIKSFKF
ncbi:hypothetical protein B0T10DRAFT_497773 [Thelonectria olida]|uniref:NACHT domain-containing protein n=1 Tax=Thelonectria olida TaxID=1576542 RepID=A0A9P8VU69_9HYPO|nr:hypothetical protein B0T10DRAFT_497773 [Thelonectria olida]